MSRPTKNLALFVIVLAASAEPALAQEKPDAPTPKTAIPASSRRQSRMPAAPTPPQNQQQDENPKRILGIIPNFESKDDIPQNRVAMTPREKYALAYHQTVDISAHFGDAFQAMLQQASDAQPHYGQGWGAYAQRFGATEADQATSAFFIYGFLPHILKEDPRYFRKRNGSTWSRLRYSATRTFITRTDAGNSTFNTPQVAGLLLQQGISTTYYPERDRSADHVFQNWGINLAYTCAYNVLKEFYPDLLRIVFHRGQHSQSAPPDTVPLGTNQ